MANTRAQKTAQNLSTLTTAGDIAYASAAGTPARLGIGSSAQVLTVASGVPSWATPAGGGKVLQVVNATYSTNVSNSTSTFADTGLTASITPTLATSKILVIVNQVGLGKATDTQSGFMGRLVRGATTIVSEFVGNGGYTGTSTTNYFGGAGLSYLDSPATTSSTTYKTQFKNFANAVAVYAQNESASSSITLMEIGV